MSQVAEMLDSRPGDAPGDGRAGRLFLGCFAAMFATSFSFIVRALVITEWGTTFSLTEAQKGAIFPGAALFPFAISIVLFSLFIDQIGYKTAMIFAWRLRPARPTGRTRCCTSVRSSHRWPTARWKRWSTQSPRRCTRGTKRIT